MLPPAPTRVELGCGPNKRAGFFGIDLVPAPGVDLVLDIERNRLPFADDSVEHLFSSHTFEHFEAPASPIPVLREMMRVAKHGALIEIWTPYLKNDAAFVFGHRHFYSETLWEQIVYLYDAHYFGDTPGRCHWEKSHYVLRRGILTELAQNRISIAFATSHLFNIIEEFGIFLRVDKTLTKAVPPRNLQRVYSYGRAEAPLDVVPRQTDGLTATQPDAPPTSATQHDAIPTSTLLHDVPTSGLVRETLNRALAFARRR